MRECANKTLLIGKKLKKFFPGFGGAIGTVTKYIFEHDAYELHYADGDVDIIQLNDILKLIPKAWSTPQTHLAEETVNEDLIMHVEAEAPSSKCVEGRRCPTQSSIVEAFAGQRQKSPQNRNSPPMG